MTEVEAHLTAQSTQTGSLAFDLRRNQLAQGVAGAGLSSALSSLLSSARGRVSGPACVAVVLVAMPGWPWVTSPRSGELIILCSAIGTVGLLVIVRYRRVLGM
jgi:hypothetical protein